MSDWVTVRWDDIEGSTPTTYRLEPHSPTNFPAKSRIPWPYCRKCGLMYLKNDICQKAIKWGCLHEQHPSWPWKKEKKVKANA